MKITKILLAAILFIQIGICYDNETNAVAVTRQPVTDDKLARALEGVRVALISDLHVQKIGRREKKLLEAIERVDPDLVVITGDFISGNAGIAPCAELVRRIARGRTVIGVLGNNDHSYKTSVHNTELLVRQLREAGATMLINRSVRVATTGNDEGWYVVGLDDNFTMNDNFFKAMANVPRDAPKILLAHAPNIVEKIPADGIGLVLSGHTHGGQIVAPFYGAFYTNPTCWAKKSFVSGLYVDDTKLYVSRGIGTVLLPLRLFCRPELTVFEFK